MSADSSTSVRGYLEKTLEDWAESIKAAVLDWDPINEWVGDLHAALLPRVPPAQLVEAMRNDVEVMLQRVAQVVNESPAGTIDPGKVRTVQELFADLVNRAVVLGLQMRLEAAEAAPEAPAPDPRSEWAKRYRSMMKTLPHPRSREPEPTAD